MPQTPDGRGSSLRVDYNPFGSSKRPAARDSRANKRRVRTYLLKAAAFAVAGVLPFLILVRLSVLLYTQWGWGNWTAVWGAAAATTLLLVFYVWLLRVRIQGRFSVPRALLGGVAGVVVAYVFYLVVYLSGANAKSPEVRAEFTALHPVMRVAVSSVLLVDRNAMITDLGRTADDYRQWGLDVNEASLHFVQPSGYVHAVDLRTRGRSALRNGAVAWGFKALGFRTLRHVGTADHLHISLPPSSR